MSTPEGTSKHSGEQDARLDDRLDGQLDDQHDQHGQPIEPIDPTLTFDAYFDKTPPSPTADETPTTANEIAPNQAEPAYTEPTYSEAGHDQPTRTDPVQGSEYSETVAPARFSNPTWTPTTAAESHPPTEADAGPRGVRMRTVVFGLVLLVIAGAVLVGQLTDVTVNAGAIVLALMIGGGLLLIAGARRA